MNISITVQAKTPHSSGERHPTAHNRPSKHKLMYKEVTNLNALCKEVHKPLFQVLLVFVLQIKYLYI